MQRSWPPEHDSIFGDTYHGVPNPMVPHLHPWPTRYHGPNYTIPGVAKPTYDQEPYAKEPYVGYGAAPIFEYVTGVGFLDAAAGAGIGYFVAPKESDRPMWMIVGALAAYAAGMAGIIGVGTLGVLLRK